MSPFHTKDTESWDASSWTQLYSGVGVLRFLGWVWVFDCALAFCVCLVGPSWPIGGAEDQPSFEWWV